METSFPQDYKSDKKYLTAKDFQDNERVLTFNGWEKVANEDLVVDGKTLKTWKERLIYTLRYSYPEWALDAAGEKMLNKKNEPFRNRNYDPKYPKGYFIRYIFAEGTLECGSMPLFNEFKALQPKPGEKISILRTGEGKETVWEVARVRKDGLKEVHDTVQIDGEEAPF